MIVACTLTTSDILVNCNNRSWILNHYNKCNYHNCCNSILVNQQHVTSLLFPQFNLHTMMETSRLSVYGIVHLSPRSLPSSIFPIVFLSRCHRWSPLQCRWWWKVANPKGQQSWDFPMEVSEDGILHTMAAVRERKKNMKGEWEILSSLLDRKEIDYHGTMF